jgi:hypothetical protein
MLVKAEEVSGLTYARETLWTADTWPTGSAWNGKNLGGKAGPPLPAVISDLIFDVAGDIPKTYRRPSIGLKPLGGSIPLTQALELFLQGMGGKWATTEPTTPDAQLAWQHFPPCYFAQMKQQYASDLALYTVVAFRPHEVK